MKLRKTRLLLLMLFALFIAASLCYAYDPLFLPHLIYVRHHRADWQRLINQAQSGRLRPNALGYTTLPLSETIRLNCTNGERSGFLPTYGKHGLIVYFFHDCNPDHQAGWYFHCNRVLVTSDFDANGCLDLKGIARRSAFGSPIHMSERLEDNWYWVELPHEEDY